LSRGSTQTGAYAGSIRAITRLPGEVTLELYANRKSKYMMGGRDDALVQQATMEKAWGSNRAQAGVIRIPFGVYDYRETYASGIIDYPMARLDYGDNSVDWGVPGVKFTTSVKQLGNLQ